MQLFLLKLIQKARAIPSPIKKFLRPFKLNALLLSFANKYTAELEFQAMWADEFTKNKPKVLEYWKKYRYFDEIDKLCGISDQANVLDVGCGISTVLHFIKGHRYGIDPLADDYKKLYRYPSDIDIRRSRGEDIPFPNENFDVVFCTNVLDHATSPQKTVSEIKRVLKKNGFFVLTVEIFEEKTMRDKAHPHSLTFENVKNLLAEGFTPVFEKTSPWIGMKNYVHNARGTDNKELITVLKKV